MFVYIQVSNEHTANVELFIAFLFFVGVVAGDCKHIKKIREDETERECYYKQRRRIVHTW